QQAAAANANGAPVATPPAALAERVAVKKDGRTLLVPTQEIDWIEAVDKYVRLHAKGARYLHREALSALERRLDPAQFLRIHRGAIVNLRRVREIHPGVGDEPTVVLADGTRRPLSTRPLAPPPPPPKSPPGQGAGPRWVLSDGTRLPLSRRYRARLRARGLPV